MTEQPHHHYPWLDETPEDSYVMSREDFKKFAANMAKEYGYKPKPAPDTPEAQQQLADEVLRMKDEPK
jgi:hypothetical protein